jgi:LuxR family maltose regulon positive regulatory protein
MHAWAASDDRAVQVLTEGAREAAVVGAPAIEANCTAALAMIAHATGDTASAISLTASARRLLVEHGLERSPALAFVVAMGALAAACAGDPETARAEGQLARAGLARFKDVYGWANVQTRIALAQTSLLLGDRDGAEAMLSETHEGLVRQPDAVGAHRQVADLEEHVRLVRRQSSIGSSSLTTAELRVLHFLPTNLTLAEISDRLFVSRYTIKTHCESIYRKLDVRSRSEAVNSARRLGLLGGVADDG